MERARQDVCLLGLSARASVKCVTWDEMKPTKVGWPPGRQNPHLTLISNLWTWKNAWGWVEMVATTRRPGAASARVTPESVLSALSCCRAVVPSWRGSVIRLTRCKMLPSCCGIRHMMGHECIASQVDRGLL